MWFRSVALAIALFLSKRAVVSAMQSQAAPGNLVQDARDAQAAGDYERAAKDYTALLKTDPSPELRSNLGVMLYLAGHDREALSQLQLAIREKRSLTAGDLFAGLALIRLGKPKEAVPLLKRAADADTQASLPRLALGRAYLAARDLAHARQLYRHATELQPDNAEAWYGLGITSRGMADAALQQAAQSGLRGDALEKSAQAISARKDLGDAQHAMSRALELEPDNLKAHMIMGESFRVAAQKEKSVAEYQAILQAHADFAPALIGLANTYWKFGDIEQAMEVLERALKLAPHDAEANGIMADLLVSKKRYADAKPLASRALAMRPDLSFVRVALAKILIAEEKDQAAVKELLQAAPDDPDGSWYYILAREWRKLGQEKEAQNAFAQSQRLRNAQGPDGAGR